MQESEQDAGLHLERMLDRAARARQAVAGDARVVSIRQRLRAWQAARLSRTHADLLADRGMGPAAAFFLEELYGTQDLGRIEADVRRIVPMLERFLPRAGLATVARAIELEALSEELDGDMARALASTKGELTAAAYGRAYRGVGRRADRERQIELIREVGASLDHLVHHRLIGTTLSLMRWPAQRAGLSALHDFLQRGYRAFAAMGGAEDFLERIESREMAVLREVFAGDDAPLRS
jgi:hypothetical protein